MCVHCVRVRTYHAAEVVSHQKVCGLQIAMEHLALVETADASRDLLSTAQHSTIQHSTLSAQHSIAQHAQVQPDDR